MAVYKRTYKPYAGRITPGWSRFLVLTRYSLEKLMESRVLLALLFACMIPILVCAAIIYLRHNIEALTVLRLPVTDIAPINNHLFFTLLGLQSLGAFWVTLWAGPGLISPDLGNNALPLYLCRPLSRTEYVLGKLAVLFILLSLVTWVPGLFLFFMQAQLEEGWFTDNWYIGPAIFLGSNVWILVLGMLALALSAWVKWRLAAGGLLFGVFFILTGFGEAVNEVLETKWGHALSIGHLIGSIWMRLFRAEGRDSVWTIFNMKPEERISAEVAWVIMAAIVALCIWILNKRLQGREVVR